MKPRLTFILLVCVLFLVAAAGCAPTVPQEQYNLAQTALHEEESRVADLQTELGETETQLAGIEDQLTEAEAQIQSLEIQLTAAENRATATEAQITDLQTGLTEAENRATIAENDAAALSEELSTTQTELDTYHEAETYLVLADANTAQFLQTLASALEDQSWTIDSQEADYLLISMDGNILAIFYRTWGDVRRLIIQTGFDSGVGTATNTLIQDVHQLSAGCNIAQAWVGPDGWVWFQTVYAFVESLDVRNLSAYLEWFDQDGVPYMIDELSG